MDNIKNNILKLVLPLLFFVYFSNCHAQTDINVLEEIATIIDSSVECRVLVSEKNYKVNFEISCGNEVQQFNGEETTFNLKVKKRRYTEYESIDRTIVFRQISKFLKQEYFEHYCINGDSTVFSFRCSVIADEDSFIEIYLPINPREEIEIVSMVEYSYPIDKINILSIDSFPELEGIEWCEQRCLIPDQYISRTRTYREYNGDGDTENLVYLEIQTLEAKTTWKREKPDKNCLSANPEDCLVWSIVDTPPKKAKLIIITDPILHKNFTKRTIESKVKVRDGGTVELKMCVCEESISDNLIFELKHALFFLEYYEGELDETIDQTFKNSLVQYQKDNSLPVGRIDSETLVHLLSYNQ